MDGGRRQSSRGGRDVEVAGAGAGTGAGADTGAGAGAGSGRATRARAAAATHGDVDEEEEAGQGEEGSSDEEVIIVGPKARKRVAKGPLPEPVGYVKPAWAAAIKSIGSLKVQEVGNQVVIKSMRCLVGELADSTALYRAGNHAALFHRLHEDGYVFMRGVLPADASSAARDRMFQYLRDIGWTGEGNAAKKGQAGCTVEYYSGTIISGQSLKAGPQSSASMDAWAAMGRHPSFQRTVLGPELARPLDLLAKGYGQYVGTKAAAKPASAFTWLRVKAPGEFTPEHADYYYLKESTDLYAVGSTRADAQAKLEDPARGTAKCVQCKSSGVTLDDFVVCSECGVRHHMACMKPPIFEAPEHPWYCADCSPQPMVVTSWIPLGDVAPTQGGLCVMNRGHHMSNMDDRDSYMQLPKSFKKEGKDALWLTADYRPGDLVVFNVKSIHATSSNQTKEFRTSADTRWVLAPVGRPNYGKTKASACALAKGKGPDA